jgi:hypothetical protein
MRIKYNKGMSSPATTFITYLPILNSCVEMTAHEMAPQYCNAQHAFHALKSPLIEYCLHGYPASHNHDHVTRYQRGRHLGGPPS